MLRDRASPVKSRIGLYTWLGEINLDCYLFSISVLIDYLSKPFIVFTSFIFIFLWKMHRTDCKWSGNWNFYFSICCWVSFWNQICPGIFSLQNLGRDRKPGKSNSNIPYLVYCDKRLFGILDASQMNGYRFNHALWHKGWNFYCSKQNFPDFISSMFVLINNNIN